MGVPIPYKVPIVRCSSTAHIRCGLQLYYFGSCYFYSTHCYYRSLLLTLNTTSEHSKNSVTVKQISVSIINIIYYHEVCKFRQLSYFATKLSATIYQCRRSILCSCCRASWQDFSASSMYFCCVGSSIEVSRSTFSFCTVSVYTIHIINSRTVSEWAEV